MRRRPLRARASTRLTQRRRRLRRYPAQLCYLHRRCRRQGRRTFCGIGLGSRNQRRVLQRCREPPLPSSSTISMAWAHPSTPSRTPPAPRPPPFQRVIPEQMVRLLGRLLFRLLVHCLLLERRAYHCRRCRHQRCTPCCPHDIPRHRRPCHPRCHLCQSRRRRRWRQLGRVLHLLAHTRPVGRPTYLRRIGVASSLLPQRRLLRPRATY